MKNNILRITTKKQWSSLDTVIALSLGYVIVFAYLHIYLNVAVWYSVLCFFVAFIIFILPAVILHIQYYNENKDK